MGYLIQILLPVVEEVDFRTILADVRGQLIEKFGGVTLHVNAPAEGLWDDGAGIERDRIVVVEVMSGVFDRAWWLDYRCRLQVELEQDEIVVRAFFIDRM
ncbi:hypothetical protein SAMN05216228_104110 [Rhizobium tibeticum]|uniref:Uncharacterized protein n=1 Tax=Rhizobium tibeticum TaxID=501024 RepID=A0A1H8VBN2_9HYPH|nr:hypothetical protein [Rhizobium tibeticum]SEI18766.1 hypothetical protein RTCCBAU85039_6000 [Rhizobium tibeticum]SEP12786.1 hypothetical protein SAMN05216228_104110 [Rhizobium tibeticum]